MRRRWTLVLAMIFVTALVAGARTATAQGDAAPAGGDNVAAGGAAAADDDGFVGLVWKRLGAPGLLIVVLSFIAIYLIAMFFVRLRRSQLLPEPLILEIEDHLDKGRLKDAVQTCAANDCVLARVVGGGLADIRGGHEGMSTVMEEIGQAEAIRLGQQVAWLNIIAGIAPMLGLMGTVMGMIFAFEKIGASTGFVEPSAMAADISLALWTTLVGLIVAVPVMFAHAALRNRLTTLLLEVGVAATDLVDRFRDVEITPAMVAQVSEALAGTSGAAADDVPPPPPPA